MDIFATIINVIANIILWVVGLFIVGKVALSFIKIAFPLNEHSKKDIPTDNLEEKIQIEEEIEND